MSPTSCSTHPVRRAVWGTARRVGGRCAKTATSHRVAVCLGSEALAHAGWTVISVAFTDTHTSSPSANASSASAGHMRRWADAGRCGIGEKLLPDRPPALTSPSSQAA
jgi:hypothetical protein